MRKMITILGPTASGKTTLAAHLAAKTGAEMISADSRQVYRGMDIGTGKDLADYVVDGKKIPYHLIDICAWLGTRRGLRKVSLYRGSEVYKDGASCALHDGTEREPRESRHSFL